MKKTITLALLVLFAFGGLAPLFATGTQEAIQGSVELTIWTHEDPNRTRIEKKYIDEFMAANPNVKVNYVTYPSDNISNLVAAAFAANQGPDIFNLDINLAYPYITNERVAPVDPTAAGFKNQQAIIDLYLPGMLSPVIVGGKLYGIPLELTNWCVYLNKKIFRDAGLDPDKQYPKTWEEVMTVSEKIVKRNGQIITRRGFDFRYNYYLQGWLPMVEQLGGKLISDDGKKAIVNDEAWLKVLRYMKDFGPAGKNLGSPTYAAARKLFDNDQNEVAMSLSGLYQELRMAGVNKPFFDSKDWMVIPYPQWAKAVKVVPNVYYGHYYMVNAQKSPVQQKAAWKLVAFMLSHGEEYLKQVGIVQPTKALMESAAFKEMPYSDVFKSDLSKAHVVYYGANSNRIETMLRTAVEGVMMGAAEPEKALADLKKAVQEALDEE